MINALLIIILSVAAGVLYRLGGSGKYPFWYREVGMMVTTCVALSILGFFHWSLILVAGLTYAAQTSYFKKKGHDAVFWNWILVGFAFSLSILPLVICKDLWISFFLRTLAVTLFTVFWSEINGDVEKEECGRGVIQIITLPILLIG